MRDPILRTAGPTVVTTALGPVEVVEAGEGRPVLALHGGMGGFDQGLILAAAVLGGPPAAGVRVLAPSRPGYLGTPLGVRRTPEAQADLYAALLDRLGLGPVLVTAVSAGGPSALAFARRHPGRCAGLVLVSACTARLDVPARVRARLPMLKAMSRVPGLLPLMGWLAARQPEKAARASILDAAECRRTLADPEAGPLMRALQESVLHRAAARLPGTANDVAVFAALPAQPEGPVGVPVLAVHGTGDRVVPFAHAERLMAADPSVELMEVAGGEHVCLFTHMDAMRARVRAFLGRLDG
ncbi:alpha/beta fold hydrolase [Xanthobacter tagetidis]|uniref:Alpha/beta hydrolase n=1 Tax=Xanthobacter tagetidis TaxID=60216 RepID=A0A3L7AFP4_9HYPH|nr:alpha/beta hydrolase [Xanthobacter tagetidis]MBB6309759.1 pimeloyl-ACP methyl ester carboxylesterase [Xanthobacter tagetidis]RLP78212.1 alpha/beta hydrolase [Xanthobacter tagetidis]